MALLPPRAKYGNYETCSNGKSYLYARVQIISIQLTPKLRHFAY